jgi:predicted AAA+ superfamily ATPase
MQKTIICGPQGSGKTFLRNLIINQKISDNINLQIPGYLSEEDALKRFVEWHLNNPKRKVDYIIFDEVTDMEKMFSLWMYFSEFHNNLIKGFISEIQGPLIMEPMTDLPSGTRVITLKLTK